jgi:chromosome segregation ATPase
MAKSTADLALILERITERLETARKDIDEYWATLEQIQKDQMKDRLDLKTISTTQESLRHELTDLKLAIKELTVAMTNQDNQLRDKQSDIQSQLVKAEEKLTGHIAHVEKWDARRWGTIGFFIAGLVSLVVNLVLGLTRK